MHINLFGLSSTPSLRGKSYVYVIVDDFSRYTWVLFWSKKVIINFSRIFKVLQKGLKWKFFVITSIRSDHGREFENIDFETHCNEHGIDQIF